MNLRSELSNNVQVTADRGPVADPASGAGPGWLLLVYRVPAEPTRLRATVWRRIKSFGAIYLQNSVAALPASTANERALRKLRHEITDMSGTATLMSCSALAGGPEVRAIFQVARNDEYEEIAARKACSAWRAIIRQWGLTAVISALHHDSDALHLIAA